MAASVLAVSGAAQVTAATTASTTNLISALWRRVNPYNPEAVTEFRRQAGRIIVASQKSVATAATAAQLMQLRAVGINRQVTVVIPDNVRGDSATFGPKKVTVHASDTTVEYQTPGDQPTVDRTVSKKSADADQIFDRAAETYRYEKSIGADDTTAGRAAEKKIADIVDGNLILAQRLAEQQTLSAVRDLDKRVYGYRRVIHPELSSGGVCGLCIAAASRRYYIRELKPIHGRCKCTIAPITDEHDIGDLMNQDDLDVLYDAAGSTRGKDLKRTRYAIEHHSELGPILARVQGEKVPFYSTTPVVVAA